MGKASDTIKNLLLVIVSLVFVAAAVEFACYLMVHTRNAHDFSYSGDAKANYAHLFARYRMYKLNPDFAAQPGCGHSPDGFRRDQAVSVKKPAGVYRIFMMGGSALYGLGAAPGWPPSPMLKNSQNTDKVVENLLNRQLGPVTGKRFEVINAGLISYITVQHLMYILERIYLYQPDMIVFLDGANDFFSALKHYNHLDDFYYFYGIVPDQLNQRSFLFALYTMARSLAKHSYFFQIVERKLQLALSNRAVVQKSRRRHRQQYKLEQVNQVYPTIARDSFLRTYKLIQELARIYGFKMLVILQPYVTFEDPAQLSPQDRQVQKITIEKMKQSSEDPGWRPACRKLLPGLFRQYDIPFRDLGQMAGPETKHQRLYADYCHFTPAGAKRVGTLIAHILEPLIKKDLAQPRPPAPAGRD